MNKTILNTTLKSVEERLQRIEYGKIIIIKYGENKIDIEESTRERIEIDGNKPYHKG